LTGNHRLLRSPQVPRREPLRLPPRDRRRPHRLLLDPTDFTPCPTSAAFGRCGFTQEPPAAPGLSSTPIRVYTCGQMSARPLFRRKALLALPLAVALLFSGCRSKEEFRRYDMDGK